VFSLGAVLYEMLTGQKAFGGKDLATIVRKVCFEEPLPPSKVRPGVPAATDAIVARALAKDAAQRYPSAKAFAEDMADAASGRRPRHQAAVVAAVPYVEAEPLLDEIPANATMRAGAVPGLALPAGKRVSLAILEGARQGERFVLAGPKVVIGRAGGGVGADIEVDDPETSRGHAAVECYGSRVLVKDLQSTNGTWVADKRVGQAELQNHDEFRLGRTRFMLIVADVD
jgi:serine/threonine-protein kinase